MAGVVFVVGVVVLLVVLQFFGRYLLNYRLDEAGVTFLVFRVLPVKTIPYGDIESARASGMSGAMFSGLMGWKWQNRLFGRVVVIARKYGMLRNVLITPDDPDRFAAQINEKCAP
jgi:hypothetical protein